MSITQWLTGLIVVITWAGGAMAGAALNDGPVQLFAEFDFDSGAYTVVGLNWGGPRHELQRELGQFYIDDPAALNRLKESWVTGEPAPTYACGYHYEILIIADQEIEASFAINLETGCGVIATKYGSYYFDPVLLTERAASYRKVVTENREFASLEDARTYLASLEGDPRLLMRMYPEWREYDGAFRFMAPCPGHYDTKVNTCLGRIRAEIETKFPGEAFGLVEAGGDNDNVLVDMQSSKTLRARFDLYEDFGDWRDYEPRLTLYWRSEK